MRIVGTETEMKMFVGLARKGMLDEATDVNCLYVDGVASLDPTNAIINILDIELHTEVET